jgi:hypothetical protein
MSVDKAIEFELPDHEGKQRAHAIGLASTIHAYLTFGFAVQ